MDNATGCSSFLRIVCTTIAEVDAKGKTLFSKRQILRNTRIVTLAVGDVEAFDVVLCVCVFFLVSGLSFLGMNKRGEEKRDSRVG